MRGFEDRAWRPSHLNHRAGMRPESRATTGATYPPYPRSQPVGPPPPAAGERRTALRRVGFTLDWRRRPRRPPGAGFADHTAQVLAGMSCVALVDLVELVRAGDELVELELALLVEPQHLRDVGVGLQAPNSEPWIRFWNSVSSASETGMPHRCHVAEAGDDDGAGLADRRRTPAPTCSPVDDADGDDRRVGALAVGDATGELGGLVHRRERVRGAELERLLALELDRVDGDDVASRRRGRRPGRR